MNIIHQPTPYSCLACVVAMITEDPIEKVFATLGHDGSERHFRFLDCAAYLNKAGFHLGACADYFGIRKIQYKQPALLIVESKSFKGTHAVYWNGRYVCDPEPENAGKRWYQYDIREWWPITKYED